MTSRQLQDAAVDGGGRGRVQQEGDLEPRGHPQGPDARGPDLPAPLRRSMVDDHPVGRLSAGRLHQEVRADVEGEIRRVHDALRSETDARRALAGAALAVRRRAAAGRGDAPADHPHRRAVRRSGARTRTARRCGWPCPGSTASSTSSRSSRSSSPRSSRSTRGRNRRRRNTASTRT